MVSVMGAFRTGKYGKPREFERPEKRGPLTGV